VKNSHGIDTVCEALIIVHIVTDDDGSLKIKQVDEFRDSKAYSGMMQPVMGALAAAKAK
jgi:hypothetical protein